MKKTIRRSKNIIPCPSRENTQLSFVDSKDLNEEVTLKIPLGDPVPKLQASFTAVAVQGLGYFWLQSLCRETLTLPQAANSPAILTMLHIGVMVSLLEAATFVSKD